MGSLSKADLWKQFRDGDLESVYLFFGNERFQRDIAVEKLSESVFSDPSFREFNENVVDLSDTELDDALAACEQLPFGGGKRLVVLKSFGVSSNRMKNSVRESDLPLLERYLSNPAPETVLVIVAEELDKRLKAAKLILNSAACVEFGTLRTDEAIRFASERFKSEGVSADQGIVRELVNLTGEDAGRIAIEVKKLAAAAQPDGIVTNELVRELVSYAREISNFELTNQLIQGKGSDAVRTLRKLLDDGVEPLALLGMLSYSFRQLVFAKEMMNRGFERPAILKRMGYRGRPDTMFGAARKAETSVLTANLVRIAETDLRIKTSVGDPRTQIEMLVCELALN